MIPVPLPPQIETTEVSADQKLPPLLKVGTRGKGSGKRERQARALEAYRRSYSPKLAYQTAEISRGCWQQWLTEPAFKRAIEEIHDERRELLYSEAYQRSLGLNGKIFSERIFLRALERHDPEWRSKSEHSIDGEIRHKLELSLPELRAELQSRVGPELFAILTDPIERERALIAYKANAPMVVGASSTADQAAQSKGEKEG